MRLIALAAFILGILTISVKATPPDMICKVNASPVSFEIILTTNNSNLNRHSIVPLSLHHSKLSIDPLVEGLDLVKTGLYTEDLFGQWLMDGRVDMHIYKEEKLENGKSISINLTINTKSTGQENDESGHTIHKGMYDLELYEGSKRDNTGKLITQFSGDVTCG
jgi:hypothetical protein